MTIRRIIGSNKISSQASGAVPECVAPTAIQVLELASGTSLQISWTPPDCDGCVSKYAIYVDSVKVGESFIPVFLWDGAAPNTTYLIEVFTINKIGATCPTGTSLSYETGTFPALDPYIIPHYKAATIFWELLEDMPDYTIEGYNVYYHNGSSFVKQNGSLLSLTTDNYLKTGLAFREEVTMAVSFEYNSGTESPLYQVTETLPGIPGGDFIMRISNTYIPSRSSGQYPFVGVGQRPQLNRGGWTPIGIEAYAGSTVKAGFKVPQDTSQTLAPLLAVKYSYVNTIASGEKAYEVIYGMPQTNYRYEFIVGCASNEGLNKIGSNPKVITLTEGVLRGGIYRDNNAFLFQGRCDGVSYNTFAVDLWINVPPDSLKAVYPVPIGWERATLMEVYNPMTPSATVTGSDVEITWDEEEGAQGYNVYLKKDGEADYTKQNNSMITGTSYDITSLTSGDYTVAVTMVYENYESIVNADSLTKDTFTIA